MTFLRTIRRWLSSWQGLLAGILALGAYLALPALLRAYDPTAGVFDAGYLQWVGLSTVLSFWAVFVGWLSWQIAFSSIDKAADRRLPEWFEALSPREKWYATQVTFALMLGLFLLALKLVPL
jgi:amino acid transporter